MSKVVFNYDRRIIIEITFSIGSDVKLFIKDFLSNGELNVVYKNKHFFLLNCKYNNYFIRTKSKYGSSFSIAQNHSFVWKKRNKTQLYLSKPDPKTGREFVGCIQGNILTFNEEIIADFLTKRTTGKANAEISNESITSTDLKCNYVPNEINKIVLLNKLKIYLSNSHLPYSANDLIDYLDIYIPKCTKSELECILNENETEVSESVLDSFIEFYQSEIEFQNFENNLQRYLSNKTDIPYQFNEMMDYFDSYYITLSLEDSAEVCKKDCSSFDLFDRFVAHINKEKKQEKERLLSDKVIIYLPNNWYYTSGVESTDDLHFNKYELENYNYAMTYFKKYCVNDITIINDTLTKIMKEMHKILPTFTLFLNLTEKKEMMLDYDSMSIFQPNTSLIITSKKVINLDTGEVFCSISDAARKYNISSKNISKVCKGKAKLCGGFHWAFAK